MKKFDVICLPYAGGNRYSYRMYEELAPPFLKIIPLEYPGRGGRMGESLKTDLHVLVKDLYSQIDQKVSQQNYAIYGHSMGGLLAYMLTREIIKRDRPLPAHLFISGTTGPSAISRKRKMRHLLSKEEFIEEIRNMSDTPEEALQNSELIDYFEPILRADFTATERYVYEEDVPLDIPVTVFTGMDEDMELEDIQLWQKETKYSVDFRRFPGNHFFIRNYASEILEIMTKRLLTHPKIYQL